MSTNCIKCVKNKRTGPDLLCDECRAKARLFAAAPDLLAACKKLVKWLDALAVQAEAQAKDRRFVILSEACARDARNYRATAADVRAAIAKAEGAPQ